MDPQEEIIPVNVLAQRTRTASVTSQYRSHFAPAAFSARRETILFGLDMMSE